MIQTLPFFESLLTPFTHPLHKFTVQAAQVSCMPASLKYTLKQSLDGGDGKGGSSFSLIGLSSGEPKICPGL